MESVLTCQCFCLEKCFVKSQNWTVISAAMNGGIKLWLGGDLFCLFFVFSEVGGGKSFISYGLDRERK